MKEKRLLRKYVRELQAEQRAKQRALDRKSYYQWKSYVKGGDRKSSTAKALDSRDDLRDVECL